MVAMVFKIIPFCCFFPLCVTFQGTMMMRISFPCLKQCFPLFSNSRSLYSSNKRINPCWRPSILVSYFFSFIWFLMKIFNCWIKILYFFSFFWQDGSENIDQNYLIWKKKLLKTKKNILDIFNWIKMNFFVLVIEFQIWWIFIYF